jgi:hypothetical protein
MDINYFLFLRKKYNSTVSSINYIIESNNEITDFQEKHNIEPLISKIEDKMIKIIFTNEKNKFLNLINICNSHIKKLCKHEFINDNIDIDLDNSQSITYCKLCELSEEYC